MSPATAAFDVRQALLSAARAELREHGRAAVSLRAVARRAGVSHAAPKHHFGDRAGLLTAVAAQGFDALADALEAVDEPTVRPLLARLGRTYVDFGAAHPALFELMFQPADLHPDDVDFRHAQQRAIGVLNRAGGASDAAATTPASSLTLLSWALAHGLSVLQRDGALEVAAGSEPLALAHELLSAYSGAVDVEVLSRP